MSTPPIRRRFDDVVPRLIPPVDSVKLGHLAGPADGSSTSVFYEVWEPRGSQPDNSHPASAEIFVILAGHGIAHSDEHSVAVGPGDVLILPVGSVHRIENSSDTEKMYAVTIMADDDGARSGGFVELVTAGPPTGWDDTDRAVLAREQP